MKTTSAFLWFFIIVGFITAAVGVAYFASGEATRSTDEQNYMVLLQIPIGLVAMLFGLSKRLGLSRE